MSTINLHFEDTSIFYKNINFNNTYFHTYLHKYVLSRYLINLFSAISAIHYQLPLLITPMIKRNQLQYPQDRLPNYHKRILRFRLYRCCCSM